MPKYIQIQAQIEKLQKEAESLRKRELAQTIANIKKAISAFGLTAQDLGLSGPSATRGRKPGKKAAGAKRRGRPPKSEAKAATNVTAAKRGRKARKKSARKSSKLDKRSVVAPKYRDAATGATWTGRGKQPRWLAAAVKGGKKLSDFLI